jgi:TM2 domain-containing membrane protein YozV
MFCSKCGKQVDANLAFCPDCGTRTAAAAVPVGGELKSKIAAGLLGIFLGGWGIHRFYLGYTTIGIIQIVVTLITLGFGGLWGFIEGIMILTGNINKDAKGQPLKD